MSHSLSSRVHHAPQILPLRHGGVEHLDGGDHGRREKVAVYCLFSSLSQHCLGSFVSEGKRHGLCCAQARESSGLTGSYGSCQAGETFLFPANCGRVHRTEAIRWPDGSAAAAMSLSWASRGGSPRCAPAPASPSALSRWERARKAPAYAQKSRLRLHWAAILHTKWEPSYVELLGQVHEIIGHHGK